MSTDISAGKYFLLHDETFVFSIRFVFKLTQFDVIFCCLEKRRLGTCAPRRRWALLTLFAFIDNLTSTLSLLHLELVSDHKNNISLYALLSLLIPHTLTHLFVFSKVDGKYCILYLKRGVSQNSLQSILWFGLSQFILQAHQVFLKFLRMGWMLSKAS